MFFNASNTNNNVEDYKDMIGDVKNSQIELIKVMLNVKENVLALQNQMSILSSRNKALEKLIIERIDGKNNGTYNNTEIIDSYQERNEIRKFEVTKFVEKFPKSEHVSEIILAELKKYTLYQSCTKTELNNIIGAFSPEEVSNEVVLSKKEGTGRFIFLEEGFLDVYEDAEGVNLRKVISAPGSFWGILSVYGKPEAFVKARGHCKLWSFYYKDYGGILAPLRNSTQKRIAEILQSVSESIHEYHIYEQFFIRSF